MTEQLPGPIDFLAVEIPGARLEGRGLAALVDLSERGIIQVLDLVVAVVDETGFAVVELTDLDGDGELDLAVFDGVRSGLLDEDDIAQSASLVSSGDAVALIVYENTWAREFVTAMSEVGAQLVASGRIPAPDVAAALDALDATAD